MAYLAFLLLILVGITGEVSYKAQDALPDTLLYSYKLSVNEHVEGLFAQSDAQKAQWHLALLQKRLDDARYLAQRGKLDASGQTNVTNNITTQVRELTTILEHLQNSGALAQAASLALDLHQTITDEIAETNDLGSQGSPTLQLALAPVLMKLRTTLSTVALLSTKAQAQAAGLAMSKPTPNPNTASVVGGL